MLSVGFAGFSVMDVFGARRVGRRPVVRRGRLVDVAGLVDRADVEGVRAGRELGVGVRLRARARAPGGVVELALEGERGVGREVVAAREADDHRAGLRAGDDACSGRSCRAPSRRRPPACRRRRRTRPSRGRRSCGRRSRGRCTSSATCSSSRRRCRGGTRRSSSASVEANSKVALVLGVVSGRLHRDRRVRREVDAPRVLGRAGVDVAHRVDRADLEVVHALGQARVRRVDRHLALGVGRVVERALEGRVDLVGREGEVRGRGRGDGIRLRVDERVGRNRDRPDVLGGRLVAVAERVACRDLERVLLVDQVRCTSSARSRA